MRVLLLAPAHASAARGNLVTVERWRRGLEERGHQIRVLVPADAANGCKDVDLVHAHHAVHCGPAALACGERGRPVVVSLGGTDLNGGPDGRPDPRAREVLEKAARIVGPFAADGERLRASVPDAAPFRLVRRGVEIDETAPAPRPGGLQGLMAGGIRRVKGQLAALRWVDEMRRRGLTTSLEIAGPEIEADYFASFLQAMAPPRADRYLGVLDHEGMRAALLRCDFLLNASLHEGASNAVLEALAIGRPVVASRVAGNREMLCDAPAEVACLVDDDEAGMESLARFLEGLRDADREALASSARTFVRERFSVARELDELEAVYRELV